MDIELNPRLITGKIIEVTEVGVKVAFTGRLGVLSVPLRMVFSDKKLEIDDEVELYISYLKVTSTKE